MNPTMTISVADILRTHAHSYPQKTATVFGDRRHTYPQLQDRTTRLANALRQSGIGEGSPLLWLGQNSDRLLEVVLAAAQLGAIICPANWRLSTGEFSAIMEDFHPAVVFWQQQEVGDAVMAAREASATAAQARWICIDDPQDEYETVLSSGSEQDAEELIDPNLPLMQIYTAAFGGKPQGALLSHTSIMQQNMLLGLMQDIDSDYVFLNSGPLFHIGVWMSTWPTFLFGGTNVFVRRVDAQELCQVIDREGCAGAYTVHSTQEEMVEINKDGRYNLKTLRGFPGSPAWNEMTTPSDSLWHRKPGGYGQTEANGLISFNCFAAQMQGSHGRPSPLSAIRIFDEDGRDVAPGDVGEMVVRGPTVMNGYYRHGAEPVDRTINGWHRTNDLGRREEDGSITFIGPKQRMLKSGVENIYPAEVEQAINSMPGVAQSAIIGIPDPKWIQTVLALVVTDGSAEVDEAGVISHCKAHMASYKKPSKVIFLDAIAKKADGSTDYDQLDETHGGGNYPGGDTRSR
jgi:acyl-CoA synthetase (AMP-forming)/AMP-acid ligase II